MVGMLKARQTLANHGWLSTQPKSFQDAVLDQSRLMRFSPGDLIYDVQDPPGGIYGLVEGVVSVTATPLSTVPRVGHVCWPGQWIGIGCYISREARRVGIRAATEAWMMYLPLEAMDQIERHDPASVRRFARILMGDYDIVLKAFLSLQKMGADRRIAAALQRISLEGVPIPLTQTDLGEMANTSRKHANAALRRFEANGWLATHYRSITIKNVAALRSFAEADDD